jgi:heat-inducible transcriptional repressor
VLTERKKTILNLIVGDYIQAAAPIASESIARKHDLGVSPATIRNDVAELEDEGYITRPHPSAGSVPMDKGYRLYVETDVGMKGGRISRQVSASIRKQLIEVESDIDGWTSVASEALAGLVGNMAIATFPKAREARVRHIDLVPLQDLLALLIVVCGQARLRRQLIRLKEPEDLQQTANRVQEKLVGHTWREIESSDMALSSFEEELVATTVLILRDEDQAEYLDHYLNGLRNLLAQPEFAEKERISAFIERIEDGSLVRAILDEAPETAVVRVVIGQENRGDMLRPLSVVIGRYGIPGEAAGAVGAVGPVRMHYTKTIAGVELMASVMSELVESVRSG